jgi:hypothetical protein
VSEDQRYIAIQYPARWEELPHSDKIAELMKLKGRVLATINAIEIDEMYERLDRK